MNGWRSWLLALLLAGGLMYGAAYLFGLQFAAGSVYPEYSSLRTDPLGTKLLYDSLAGVPGVTVERNYRALEFLPEGVTVLLVAIPAASFGSDTEPYLRSMEESARRGNRMVAALTVAADGKLPDFEELTRKWQVTLGLDTKSRRRALYFAGAKGWTVLERQGDHDLVIERAFGKGSIVLFARSRDFSNQAVVESYRLRMVSLAVGPNPHIIFDEQHLGIADAGSVVALARRFHLMGFALGLAICAALILWRNGVDFPPPAGDRTPAALAGRTSQAGLVTLLRRHIPPRGLAAACWQEWLNGNRGQVSESRLRQAQSILASGGEDPVLALHEIQRVLQAKGEL